MKQFMIPVDKWYYTNTKSYLRLKNLGLKIISWELTYFEESYES